MRKHWIACVVIMTVCLTGFVTVIYKYFIRKPNSAVRHLYLLNTDSMQEAVPKILHLHDGPGIINIFPANHENGINDTIPCADVFVCESRVVKNSLDTNHNVLVLDIKTDNSLKYIKEPDNFWTDIKPAKKYKKCKILISKDELDTLKKYNYAFRYGTVTLVTDDNNK